MSSAAGEPVGVPAEEARRLVEALGDWASTRLGTAEQHLATGSAECRICPVCQLISALRGDGPEIVARLGDAWTAFLGALHHPAPPAPSHPSAAPPESAAGPDVEPHTGPDPDPPIRPVQNIEIR